MIYSRISIIFFHNLDRSVNQFKPLTIFHPYGQKRENGTSSKADGAQKVSQSQAQEKSWHRK